MKCLIIDDDATARLIINQFCKNDSRLEILEEFPDPIQAMKYLNHNEVDLIFLDIHMPNFNGFDFMQSLKNPPRIILTTSDTNFAIEAFEYDCVIDYLVKPIALSRFKKAINKALKSSVINSNINKSNISTEESEDDLYVNIDRRLIKIDIPSIYLIEAKGDYILIKTDDKNHTVHSTLKKIESKLPISSFLKVHRSYVINTNEIIDIEDNSVLIRRDVIPVSRSNRPELMRRLNLL
jgi:DNA-binding LytR/AlgR family response regulator